MRTLLILIPALSLASHGLAQTTPHPPLKAPPSKNTEEVHKPAPFSEQEKKVISSFSAVRF